MDSFHIGVLHSLVFYIVGPNWLTLWTTQWKLLAHYWKLLTFSHHNGRKLYLVTVTIVGRII